MDFEFSNKVNELRERVLEFMHGNVYPNEQIYRLQTQEGGRWCVPPVMEEMKA